MHSKRTQQQPTSKHSLKKQLMLFVSAATAMASAYAAAAADCSLTDIQINIAAEQHANNQSPNNNGVPHLYMQRTNKEIHDEY